MDRHPAPLLRSILLNLQQQGSAPAICFDAHCISNTCLLLKTRKLARQLLASGIHKGSIVAVYMERCPDVLVLLLALWYCQAVYLPLDLSWPAARLRAVLDQAKPGCLVTQPQLQHCTDKLPCPAILLHPIVFDQEEAPLPELAESEIPLPQADELAYILFTSGSTGIPKGVKITHHNLANLFGGILPLLQIQAGWRVLGCASFSFDIVFFELLAPLLCKATLVLANQAEYRDPQALGKLISQMNIAVVQATPSLWSLLTQTAAWEQSPLKLALATGEALPTSIASKIFNCTETLWNLYGPTECTIWASAHKVEASDLALSKPGIAIGKALPGYQLALIAVDANKGGELVIGGAGVGAGYLHAELHSTLAADTHSGSTAVYRTGDYCCTDAKGNWHFLERVDSQLKVNGYRIEADELALRLQQHASIRQAVCLAKKHADGVSARLLAFVVCHPNTPNKDKQRWNEHLAQWLPAWMLPDRYYMLDEIPLTSSGKIDRQALLSLADPDYSNQQQQAGSVYADTARIFCELLELEQIGPYDSFFDAGGNSMLAATLVLAVNEHFRTAISLRAALAVPPTLNSIAQLVQHQLAKT